MARCLFIMRSGFARSLSCERSALPNLFNRSPPAVGDKKEREVVIAKEALQVRALLIHPLCTLTLRFPADRRAHHKTPAHINFSSRCSCLATPTLTAAQPVPRENSQAFAECAKVFIHYLTANANDICHESKRQTISVRQTGSTHN